MKHDLTNNLLTIPPEWGSDPLSQFIQDAIHNTHATFHNLKTWYNKLRDIHITFRAITQNMDGSPNWFSSFFLFRSHAAFLAGVRLAMSGQVPESYMVLRGCLESALYGLYVTRKPTSKEIWLKRHNDEPSKKKVKQNFKISNLFQVLEIEDKRLYTITRDLYDRTIDYGGHPNERAFLSVVKKEADESKTTFQSAYLIGNEPAHKLCLKSCAQIGICALCIFRTIFRERFDILGLSETLEKLKKGL